MLSDSIIQFIDSISFYFNLVDIVVTNMHLIHPLFYSTQYKDSQDEREMQTDDDCMEVKSDTERAQYTPSGTPRTHHVMSQDTSLEDDSSKLAEAASVPLPCDAEDAIDDENTEVKVEELGDTAGIVVLTKNILFSVEILPLLIK